MKILVVGAGSIGQRHMANLQALGAQVTAFSYRAVDGVKPLLPAGVALTADWRSALVDCDGVVIANQTDRHVEVAAAAAMAGKGFLVEKPLAISPAGCTELLALVQAKGLAVECGFMLRFHPNLVWMAEQLGIGVIGRVLYARAAVGQWLPDWRPGTDHRNGYARSFHTGGGVIFDLIHEIDLINWLVGQTQEVVALAASVSELEIPTEAIAQIGLLGRNGTLSQVHLDYVRPSYGRSLEIVGMSGVLTWDYPTGTVKLSRRGDAESVEHRVPTQFQRNSMFLELMGNFLDRLRQPGRQPVASLEDGLADLRVALAAHRSIVERRNISIEEISAS